MPQAFELWRRGQLDEGGFRTACRRAALEDEWTNGLVALQLFPARMVYLPPMKPYSAQLELVA